MALKVYEWPRTFLEAEAKEESGGSVNSSLNKKYLNHSLVPQTCPCWLLLGKEEEEGERKENYKVDEEIFRALKFLNLTTVTNSSFVQGSDLNECCAFLAGWFTDESVFDQTRMRGMRELVQFQIFSCNSSLT
ncbi:hypothetical protein L6164_007013 [Bauhinia variegata]|uniref:Uncharacterized protein n=1 Tax=Bauhinia variegata TaxID=167791 RepID=A0ACB9PXP8_BAUVA|nr:hypothetical protein L6164_007013 [Bauhinia variegata]